MKRLTAGRGLITGLKPGANGKAETKTEDVTEALAEADGRMVSPAKLRGPHYRGLAEPHGVVLDFGPLDAMKHPVLALTGWLRFGGGMANIAGAHDPEFPFPFPRA